MHPETVGLPTCRLVAADHQNFAEGDFVLIRAAEHVARPGRRSPSATRYCFPPERMMAYTTSSKKNLVRNTPLPERSTARTVFNSLKENGIPGRHGRLRWLPAV
jgi:hypothetical protein